MKCLICQSEDYRVIFSYNEPDQYERTVGVGKNNYFRQWVQCEKCGFYYSIYSRNKDAFDKLYNSFYRDDKSPWRKESAEKVFQRVINLPENESETKFRVKWIKEKINDIWEQGLLKKDTPPYKFLDIGGGNGIFAYEFKNTNWKPYVIDPSKDSTFIRSKLNIPLVQDYYKPNSFNCKFNLISLIYVLEHLKDPVSFIRDVAGDITSDSFLYIEVPDAECFRDMPAKDDIFNSCHLWMFSSETLRNFLGRYEFETLSLNQTKAKRGHYALMALVGKK